MFQDCTALTSITLPDKIKMIEPNAFNGCEKLSSITKGNSITTIGHNAFSYCKALKSFEIDDNIKELGFSVFAHSGLETVAIPGTITSVGGSIFYDCRSLTAATFIGNANITAIPEAAFAECSSLSTVTLGENITELGTAAFAQCSSLIPGSVLETYKNITAIGESAFYGSKIKALELPDNVVSVGKAAFASCLQLETVTLGKNTVLGEGVFMHDDKLADIKIGENGNYTLKDGVLFDKDMKTLVLYPAALDNGTHKFRYKVPASVTKIAPCAFQNVHNLRNVALPDGLTEIGWMGLDFAWESMTIPSKVTTIGEVALASAEKNDRPIYFLPDSKPAFNLTGSVKYAVSGTIGGSVSISSDKSKHNSIRVYVKPSAVSAYADLAGSGDAHFKSVSSDVPMGTLPASGWKSIGRDFDVDLSGTNITAYIVTSVSDDGKKAYMEPTKVAGKEDGKYIPSRTGIETYGGVEYDKYTGAVLYVDPTTAGAGELTYKIGESEDAVLTQQTNYLYPAVVDTYTTMTEMKDGVKYCNLALNDGKFKQYSDDGITGYNKTILSLPETMVLGSGPAGSKMMLSLCIKDETETADIKDIAAECGDDRLPWFTLAGQRTGGCPSVKGIYIHNGKKVVIK